MIAIELDEQQMKRLLDATKRAKKKFPKELSAAINAVSKKTKLEMGRDIRGEVTLKKKQVEAPLSIRAKATPQSLSAIVTLKKTKRLNLRDFGARQTKRGVSYKISKHGGRKNIPGAFIVHEYGNRVFKRRGKPRLPIVKLQGVSAYGVYKKNELSGPQVKRVEAELNKQIERRINLNILRAEGLVKT